MKQNKAAQQCQSQNLSQPKKKQPNKPNGTRITSNLVTIPTTKTSMVCLSVSVCLCLSLSLSMSLCVFVVFAFHNTYLRCVACVVFWITMQRQQCSTCSSKCFQTKKHMFKSGFDQNVANTLYCLNNHCLCIENIVFTRFVNNKVAKTLFCSTQHMF